LGHATAYTFASLVAVVILRRRLRGLEWRRLARPLGQILLAGAATGAVALLVSRAVGRALGTAALGPQLLQVGGAVLAGLVTFIGLAVAFRLPELALIRQTLRTGVGRR